LSLQRTQIVLFLILFVGVIVTPPAIYLVLKGRK